jgi:hypothetical protein
MSDDDLGRALLFPPRALEVVKEIVRENRPRKETP